MRDNIGSVEQGSSVAEEWGPGYSLFAATRAWLSQRGPEGTVPLVRMASHLLIVAVAVAVLWVSHLQLPTWQTFQVATGAINGQAAPNPPVELLGSNAVGQGSGLSRVAVPFTLSPSRPRADLFVYTVAAGDTLYDIADRYHISADTLVWANNLDDNPDLLRLGQQLVILPTNGVLYTVAPGDSLESIAKKYSAQVSDMVGYAWNRLDAQNPTLTVGQRLIVPNGVKAEPPRAASAETEYPAEYAGAPANAPRGAGRFIWPISGMITQGFWRYHPAIDIGSYIGDPIKAADSGYVAIAGWSNEGYGNYVVLDHRNGFQTLYAHMSRIMVVAGQAVTQGQTIGLVGTTGNSTGPHLHFEIHLNGIQQDPFDYLP